MEGERVGGGGIVCTLCAGGERGMRWFEGLCHLYMLARHLRERRGRVEREGVMRERETGIEREGVEREGGRERERG